LTEGTVKNHLHIVNCISGPSADIAFRQRMTLVRHQAAFGFLDWRKLWQNRLWGVPDRRRVML